MDLQIRPMTSEERKYSYTQSQQLMTQCGGIGYLHGDFGRNGTEFYSTWFDHNKSLKTEEFKSEFDDVINALRSDDYGLLKDRSSMDRYGYEHKESSFEGNYCKEYGFRADTEKYAYLIRCNPNAGDYNFYVFPYESKWLDRNIEKARQGIRFIKPDYKELFRIPDGEEIQITFSDGEKGRRTCRYVDETHFEIVNGDLYHICQFAEIMERNGSTVIPMRSTLPEKCYSILPSTGEIIMIRQGEQGYYPTDFNFKGKDDMRRLVNKENGALGVTKQQVTAMLAGSMFGWSSPAANPNNYDKDGNLIKPKQRQGRKESR